MSERHEQENRLSRAYERVLERLEKGAGDLSWESLQREMDDAIEFEADLETYTKAELALLRAWVERDMRDLRQFLAHGGEGIATWLGIDLGAVSRRVTEALFSIADRTTVDQARFADDLEAARADYVEGEMAVPGRMRCVHCDTEVILETITRLEPCHHCGHRYFARARG